MSGRERASDRNGPVGRARRGGRDPRVPYTFATLACSVATLVDRLGYDRFDVLGISGGSAVLAQQLAFQNPRRRRRLVLVSTGTGRLMVPARLGVLGTMITPRRYILLLLDGVGWSSLPSLPLIRQPTLVLAGNDDTLIPTVKVRILHAVLPHSTTHVHDDGHLGLPTSADDLGPLVSTFLTSPSGEDATAGFTTSLSAR